MSEKNDPTEEEYFEAIDKWLEENPNKDINDIPTSAMTKINGKDVNFGEKLRNIRRNKALFNSENMGKLINEYGLKIEKKENYSSPNRIPDDVYFKAIDKWLEENPGKTINDISSYQKIEIDGEIIGIGEKLKEIRLNISSFDEENMQKLINEYGFKMGKKEKKEPPNKIPADIYFRAIDKWLEENKDKTINEMPKRTKVIIDGLSINIGAKLSSLKMGINLFSEEDMQKLINEYGFKMETKYSDEKYFKALDKWLEENPNKTANDMLGTVEVDINGQLIPIGYKLLSIRNGRNPFDDEENMKKLINKYGFKIEKKRVYEYSDEDILKAIDEFFRINDIKSINDIKKLDTVIVDGMKIPIGRRLSEIRNGKRKLSDANMKILREKYGFKTREELDNETGFIREIEPLKKETKEIIVKEKSYEKYLDEFDGDVVKAKEKYNRISEINRRIRENKKNKKRKDLDLNEVLKHFNIDIEELNKYLNQISNREEISPVIKYEDGETLRNYCIRNGYNYSVIYNLYNTNTGKSLKELIEYYRKNGQKLPTRKVYTKDEVLLKHMLLYLGLDSESIIRDMEKYEYTLPEAIRNDVFRKNVTKNGDKWLEELYDDLVDSVNENKTSDQIQNDILTVMAKALTDLKGLINEEEYLKVADVFMKCVTTMRDYCMLEVGIEKDRIKRKERIKNYNLDDVEITKGTLMGLDFENGVKRADKTLKSERLQTMKPLIINWNSLNEKQREKMIKDYNLTQEEIDKIIEYNNKLTFNLKIN